MSVGTTILGARTATLVDGIDFSGDFNQASLNYTQAELDVSTFGTQGWKRKIVSISDASYDLTGFGQAAGHTLDAKLFSMLGAPASPNVLEIDTPVNAVGGIRYIQNVFLKSYKADLKVEDAYKLSASFSITGSPVRSLITS